MKNWRVRYNTAQGQPLLFGPLEVIQHFFSDGYIQKVN